jgi:hypothetical protein
MAIQGSLWRRSRGAGVEEESKYLLSEAVRRKAD